MGRLLLIARLVGRDLRHRPSDAILLLLAVAVAATTLTLGLVLHGVTSGPYERTRGATAGPDLVAEVSPGPAGDQPAVTANLIPLEKAPGIIAHSGPFPYLGMTLHANGYAVAAEVEGRDQASSAVDRPLLTAGSWVRPGQVVIERSFASALGVDTGNTITLNGRSFLISGIAVSAAIPAYPALCAIGCDLPPSVPGGQPGLIWMTKAELRGFVKPWHQPSWLMNLRLASPAAAAAYATGYDNTHTAWSAPFLVSWLDLASADARVVASEQIVLLIGSWLLSLLAVASVAVLAGGRMAGQVRRVGLLKAVGAGPGLVAVVLLAEHLVLALAAAAAGLTLGWLLAPLLTSPAPACSAAPARHR